MIFINPIIKWAGGKRLIIDELRNRVPQDYGTYFEPFVGAGALFFDIMPVLGHINDFNPSLINLYTKIRDFPEELKLRLDRLQSEYNDCPDKSEYYYLIRDYYNSILGSNSVEEASLFIFLNRTNYNGLYRVNSSGKYNVPFGKRYKVNLMSSRINEISNLLQNKIITNLDFEEACENVEPGDFVYFDPPYYKTFDNYKINGFTEEDQRRLFRLFERLCNMGVHCMVSNSNAEFIYNLYRDYNICEIPVKRLINRNADRRNSTEIIITNYEVNND